jgi:hypothetical protein
VFDPSDPDFNAPPPGLLPHFDSRLRNLPIGRIRTMADFFALRSVEEDHIGRVARQYGLSDTERRSVEAWWLHQIQVPLDGQIRDLGDQRRAAFMHQMKRRHARGPRLRSEFLFQVWFNSLGPGGRTWFGNRYISIRHYTFRLHWRP